MVDALIRALTNAKDSTLKGKHGKQKARDFAEVTTSIDLIDKQIALIPQDVILDLSKTVLDPCTGDGRYLMRYLYHRMDAISDARSLLQALSTLHGVELQAENVMRARANLVQVATAIAIAKGFEVELLALAIIVIRNIRQGDFLDATNNPTAKIAHNTDK